MANDGGVYQRSVDTSGHNKNAEYCAMLIIADIYDIGPTKVVMFVTDTCAVMRKCWRIVQDEFPWISAAPCQTHCPSLLLNDVARLPVPAQTIKDETLVVAWFSNHHKPLALLRSKVQTLFGKSCELKKAGATRMGTNTWVGERLALLKSCLQQVVVDPDYIKENYKDLPTDMDQVNGEKVAREHKGGTAKKFVLDDDSSGGFWQRVDDHVSLSMPLCKFLRRHDSSAPAVGKVYHGWFEMGEHLKNSQERAALPPPPAQPPLIVTCPLRRWRMRPRRWKNTKRAGHTRTTRSSQLPTLWTQSSSATISRRMKRYTCPAPLTTPHPYFPCASAQVMDGFFETLEKVAILLKVRSMEENDEDMAKAWAARKVMIEADPLKQKSMDHYPTYPTKDDDDVKEFCANANAQLAMYRGRRGIFARAWVMDSAREMPAHLW